MHVHIWNSKLVWLPADKARYRHSCMWGPPWYICAHQNKHVSQRHASLHARMHTGRQTDRYTHIHTYIYGYVCIDNGAGPHSVYIIYTFPCSIASFPREKEWVLVRTGSALSRHLYTRVLPLPTGTTSPGWMQTVHPCSPLYCVYSKTLAFPGRSAVPHNTIALHLLIVWSGPTGTSIPVDVSSHNYKQDMIQSYNNAPDIPSV